MLLLLLLNAAVASTRCRAAVTRYKATVGTPAALHPAFQGACQVLGGLFGVSDMSSSNHSVEGVLNAIYDHIIKTLPRCWLELSSCLKDLSLCAPDEYLRLETKLDLSVWSNGVASWTDFDKKAGLPLVYIIEVFSGIACGTPRASNDDFAPVIELCHVESVFELLVQHGLTKLTSKTAFVKFFDTFFSSLVKMHPIPLAHSAPFNSVLHSALEACRASCPAAVKAIAAGGVSPDLAGGAPTVSGGSGAGGGDAAVVRPKYLSITAARQLCLQLGGAEDDTTDAGAPVGPTLTHFMLELQAFIFKTFILLGSATQHSTDEKASSTVRLVPDRGLAETFVDPSPKKTASLFTTNLLGVRLNFVGNINTVKRKDCLPLCTFLGQALYIEPGPYGDPTDSSFVPAWAVDSAGKGKVVNMHAVKTIFKYKYAYGNLFKKRQVTVPVTIYSLVAASPLPSASEKLLNNNEQVPMVRPVIEEQYKPVAGTKQKDLAAGVAPSAGAVTTTSMLDKSFKIHKHLLK